MSDYHTIERTLPEHDVKHWGDQDQTFKNNPDSNFQNKKLSDMVAYKNNDYFTYDHDVLQSQQKEDQSKIGELMQ